MIIPTIGRVVWFQPAKNSDQPLRDQPFSASVAYVHGDRMINIGFFDQNGVAHNATSVTLLQDDEVGNACGYFAQWMPYQVAVHKKDSSAA
jgi:hypothetical protein